MTTTTTMTITMFYALIILRSHSGSNFRLCPRACFLNSCFSLGPIMPLVDCIVAMNTLMVLGVYEQDSFENHDEDIIDSFEKSSSSAGTGLTLEQRRRRRRRYRVIEVRPVHLVYHPYRLYPLPPQPYDQDYRTSKRAHKAARQLLSSGVLRGDEWIMIRSIIVC